MKLNMTRTIAGVLSFLAFASVSFAQTADIKPGMSQDAVINKLGKPTSVDTKTDECPTHPGISSQVQYFHYKQGKIMFCDGKVEAVYIK